MAMRMDFLLLRRLSSSSPRLCTCSAVPLTFAARWLFAPALCMLLCLGLLLLLGVTVTQLAEIRVSERLASGQPIVRVVGQDLQHQLNCVWRRMWDQLRDARTLRRGKVEVDVGRVLPELLEQLLRRSAEHTMDLVDLIQLVCAWEEREETDNLKEHAADSPNIHLVIVVAVCQQTFRRSIPARRDVLGVRLFAVYAAARAEVCELQHVVRDEDVLL